MQNAIQMAMNPVFNWFAKGKCPFLCWVWIWYWLACSRESVIRKTYRGTRRQAIVKKGVSCKLLAICPRCTSTWIAVDGRVTSYIHPCVQRKKAIEPTQTHTGKRKRKGNSCHLTPTLPFLAHAEKHGSNHANGERADEAHENEDIAIEVVPVEAEQLFV